MTELASYILQFVAEETGCNPSRLSLDSRLLHDLGMDGDDANEFFQKFEKTYKVDLAPLYQQWDQYFGPEPSFSSVPLGGMIAIVAAVLLGDVLNRIYNPIPGWAWMIALLAAATVVHAKFFTEPVNLKPITIRELVDAASRHTWVHQDICQVAPPPPC